MERSMHRSCNVFLVLSGVVVYWAALPAALLFGGMRLDRLLSFSPLPLGAALGVGVIAVAVGVIVSCWCAVVFYVRGGGFPLAFLPPVRLVREGPYALSRHPLYIAFVIYFIGLSAIVRSAASLIIVAPAFVTVCGLYALLHEERVLSRHYGENYLSYRQQVPFLFRLRRRGADLAIPGPGIVASLVYLVGKPVFRVLFPTVIKGAANLPQTGPAIVIANHACYLDPVFLVAAGNRYIRFVTTGEMMRSGIGRWLFTRFGSIPTSRYRADPAGVRGMLTALSDGEIVGVFPEGERTWDGGPLSVPDVVSKLLRRANVPIIPCRIRGSYAVYPRWSRHPLPGSIDITVFPPVLPPASAASVSDALSQIAVSSDGRSRLRHSTSGLELLFWACPTCNAIGSIVPRGGVIACTKCNSEWRIDRRLHAHSEDGGVTPIVDLYAPLRNGEPFLDRHRLVSIGEADVSGGGQELRRITSGEVTYNNGVLRAGDFEFSLTQARSIRLEGKTRLDIGLDRGQRVRLLFHRDSPLKWEVFLNTEIGRRRPASEEAG